MINTEKIRNMSDEELIAYIRELGGRRSNNCVMCGKRGTRTVKITNEDTCQTKTLCKLCSADYEKLIDFLNVAPIIWE